VPFALGGYAGETPLSNAAYRGLLYTAAGKGDVILNARTGADEVANVAIAPDLVVPGYGLSETIRTATTGCSPTRRPPERREALSCRSSNCPIIPASNCER
jgi:hypothetical protein